MKCEAAGGTYPPASKRIVRWKARMIPLIVLLISFAVLRLTGYLGMAPLDNWNLPLRISFFLMFMLTASAHWGRGRPDLIRMAPAVFPAAGAIITITGILEVLGGVGLLIPRTARAAAICLAILLVAMFPTNVRAARKGLTILGRNAIGVAVRGAMEAFFIGALLSVAALNP
jgi:uncharacterized membrane protein